VQMQMEGNGGQRRKWIVAAVMVAVVAVAGIMGIAMLQRCEMGCRVFGCGCAAC
jgi:hypothetical protein